MCARSEPYSARAQLPPMCVPVLGQGRPAALCAGVRPPAHACCDLCVVSTLGLCFHILVWEVWARARGQYVNILGNS